LNSSTTTLSEAVELERKSVLDSYAILDTPRDGSFDHIARLAATLLDIPIAVISLVDTDRIWFKSTVGLDVQQINREPGLCSSAILSPEFYMVEDAIRDPRTMANSLVTGNLGIRFYAAAPLTTRTGYNLGTLGVIDMKSRTLSEQQRSMMQQLARIVMDQMEIRLSVRQAFHFQRDVAYQIAHDLKKPLFSIKMLTEFLRDPSASDEEKDEFLRLLDDSAVQGMSAIEDFLEIAHSVDHINDPELKAENLSELVEKVLASASLYVTRKSHALNVEISPNIRILCDFAQLETVLDNLVNNSIKYTAEGGQIGVRVWSDGAFGRVEISDNGQGFTNEDLNRAFEQYGKLSARPTGGESSSGFGLWIAHRLVRAHNGHISIQSDGRNKGTKIEVAIPLA
jgi:signal transduction histidine kinase